jgi:hypothetical protein
MAGGKIYPGLITLPVSFPVYVMIYFQDATRLHPVFDTVLFRVAGIFLPNIILYWLLTYLVLRWGRIIGKAEPSYSANPPPPPEEF